MPFSTHINWKKEIPAIRLMGAQGSTIVEIAKHYGVSRQRANQIVKKYIPEWKQEYGWVVRRQDKQQEYFQKWGNKVDSDLYKEQRAKFRAKKYNSMRVGHEWTISFGEVVWNTHCPILGIELEYFAEGVQENSPSFDRIDSNLGYIPGNVQVISWRANRIKNDGTSEEHRKIADYLDSLSHSTT